MRNQTTYLLLVGSGATPFAACAVLLVLGVDSLPFLGPTDRIAALYGLAILCFLTGVHWATHLYQHSSGLPNLFVLSNAVFLGVLLSYALGGVATGLMGQLIAFPLLLAVDARLRVAGAISDHYFRVRAAATGVAWLSLAVTWSLTAAG
jgi:hypothetical protein